MYYDFSTRQTDGYRSLSHNDIVTELHRQRLKPHVSSDYLSDKEVLDALRVMLQRVGIRPCSLILRSPPVET